MTKQTIYTLIAVGVAMFVLGFFTSEKFRGCPTYTDRQPQIDSLTAAVHYHQMMEDSAWAEAMRFAAQRDSAMNNPIVIKERQQYRSHVQKTLDAGTLYDVLDTLRAPAGEWLIAR